ncbi:LppU/SCO3897 family protein [Streptomyces lydicus]|uniref:LppU/SCO3897 family protein n=1 Tax=Streptomyces lydicus TaxID=47763 RepID=UPI00379758F3
MATPPPPHGPHPYTQPPGQPPMGPYAPQQPTGPYGQQQPAGPYAPQQPAAPYAQQPAGPYAPQQPAGPYAPQQPTGPYAPPGHPAPAPPQAPYGYPQQLHPHAQPDPVGCQFCGAQPAVQATVRGHQGILYVMRFLSRSGVFCRSCGLATYREMSAKTLWQGWWSPLSVVITPITLLVNLGPRSRFHALAAPVGGFRPSLDPGKPLLRRPETLLILIPLALLALALTILFVIGLFADDSPSGPLTTGAGQGKAQTLAVGDCVRNDADWPDQDLRTVDCGSADAQYKVSRRLDSPAQHCADGDYLAALEYSPDGATTSCLTPVR